MSISVHFEAVNHRHHIFMSVLSRPYVFVFVKRSKYLSQIYTFTPARSTAAFHVLVYTFDF